MYNIAEMHPAFAAFWTELRQRATALGATGLPEALRFDRPAVPERIGPEVAFTQVCGFPLQTRLKGQATILLTPVYAVPGCYGPMHTAFWIVREGSPYRRLEDLRGARLAVNSLLSNSGMNLPRASLAPIAGSGPGPFFGSRALTGSHTASIEQVADGRVDVAAIDCVTDAVFRRHRPDLMRDVRILAETVQSPSLPFVTAVATPDVTTQALRQALSGMAGDTAGRAVLAGLMIAGFERMSEADYRVILEHQDDAARQGYPELV